MCSDARYSGSRRANMLTNAVLHAGPGKTCSRTHIAAMPAGQPARQPASQPARRTGEASPPTPITALWRIWYYRGDFISGCGGVGGRGGGGGARAGGGGGGGRPPLPSQGHVVQLMS